MRYEPVQLTGEEDPGARHLSVRAGARPERIRKLVYLPIVPALVTKTLIRVRDRSSLPSKRRILTICAVFWFFGRFPDFTTWL